MRHERGVAKYRAIAEDLRNDIAEGRLRPGERLPSEEYLAEYYRVQRMTLRNALSLLREWGLVETRHGAGTYVTPPSLPAGGE